MGQENQVEFNIFVPFRQSPSSIILIRVTGLCTQKIAPTKTDPDGRHRRREQIQDVFIYSRALGCACRNPHFTLMSMAGGRGRTQGHHLSGDVFERHSRVIFDLTGVAQARQVRV